jgi:hypothetical protein
MTRFSTASGDSVEKLCNGFAAEILIHRKPDYGKNRPLWSNNITQNWVARGYWASFSTLDNGRWLFAGGR